jgi:hypothetical protein
LFHGKDDWGALQLTPRVRIAVYAAAFDALARHDVAVIIRGVKVKRLRSRYVYPDHPHAVVLMHLLERIHDQAKAQDQLALVIADEVDQADTYRRSLWHFQRYTTGGYRSIKLDRIVDTIHFAPSRASRLVQAADPIAYLWRRLTADVERDARAVRANEALRTKIEAKIVHRRCWWP